jgi:hypothetical protein
VRELTGISSKPPGSRRKNSKTPCFPGFFAVMNVDQAHAVTGGKTDRSGPLTPSSRSFARFGIDPSSIHGPMRSNVVPSSAMTRARRPAR